MFKGISVLIAEAEKQYASELKKSLVSFGFTDITIVHNIEDIKIKCREHLPDIVFFSDEIMNENYLDAFQRLKQLNERLQIIFLTGTDNDLYTGTILPDEIIKKPYSEDLLFRAVMNAMIAMKQKNLPFNNN